MSGPDKHTHIQIQKVFCHLFLSADRTYLYVIFSLSLTLTSAAAALKLIFATDSLLRRRGSRLRPERELVKEQIEVAPGVMGV